VPNLDLVFLSLGLEHFLESSKELNCAAIFDVRFGWDYFLSMLYLTVSAGFAGCIGRQVR
jgi:hypothetical protein